MVVVPVLVVPPVEVPPVEVPPPGPAVVVPVDMLLDDTVMLVRYYGIR